MFSLALRLFLSSIPLSATPAQTVRCGKSDAIRVEYDGAALRVSALAPCLTLDGLADMVAAIHHVASTRRLDVSGDGGNGRLRKTA